MKKIRYKIVVGLVLISLFQCSSPSSKKNVNDKLLAQSATSKSATPPIINYHLISTKDSSDWLLALPLGDTLQTLLVLNRIDRENLLRIDTLVVPDVFGIGIEFYSPFNAKVEELQSINKILFVSYYAQAFAVYEKGNLIKWGPVSLGKQSSPTPTGLLSTNWKSKRAISTVNSSWIMDWYFNIANFQGSSIHQYALPGYPGSHSCVRMYEEDAYWIYNWADQWVLDGSKISVYGTPVVIFGTYPFGQRKPWLLQAENNMALEITSSALMDATQEFLPTIIERQTKRDSLQSHLKITYSENFDM